MILEVFSNLYDSMVGCVSWMNYISSIYHHFSLWKACSVLDTMKENRSRRDDDDINVRVVIAVAGTPKTLLFSPFLIQVGNFFPCVLCVSYDPLKTHKSA